MSFFKLRNATTSDAPAIARIYRHYVCDTCISFEEIAPSPHEIEFRIQKVLQAGLPYVVAEGSDRGVLGFAYVAPFHVRSGYRYTVEDSIYVGSDQIKRIVSR